jgi:glycogen debranching enzyme
MFRRDTQHVHANQRIETVDALGLFSTQRRLKRKSYDIHKVLKHSLFAIEDAAFNSILVRANQCLGEIAEFIKEDLPADLVLSMQRTETALEQLWDPYSGQYYPRDFVTHTLIREPSIATLLPLYAGTISKERADQLVRLLENQHVFGVDFPVPSVPPNSAKYDDLRYWQGPAWVNTNWLIIEGLKRFGYHDHATALRESTIAMVDGTDFYEYYNARTGEPLGISNFSWTAALTIDLLKNKI